MWNFLTKLSWKIDVKTLNKSKFTYHFDVWYSKTLLLNLYKKTWDKNNNSDSTFPTAERTVSSDSFNNDNINSLPSFNLLCFKLSLNVILCSPWG